MAITIWYYFSGLMEFVVTEFLSLNWDKQNDILIENFTKCERLLLRFKIESKGFLVWIHKRFEASFTESFKKVFLGISTLCVEQFPRSWRCCWGRTCDTRRTTASSRQTFPKRPFWYLLNYMMHVCATKSYPGLPGPKKLKRPNPEKWKKAKFSSIFLLK